MASIISGVNPVTEDFTRIGGFIAGCGEASLLVILHATKGTATDPTTLGNVIRAAASHGWVDSDGTAKPSGLIALANSYGVGLTSGNWQTMLSQYAGERPIIVGVANASAFGGRDAGVNGHYVTVVGKDGNGNYIVSDPNASSKFGKFDTYTQAQFAAARPFWAAVPTNFSGGMSTITSADLSSSASSVGVNPLDPSTWLAAIQSKFSGIFTWLTDPIRIVKVLAGVVMIGIASALMVVSIGQRVAPPALEAAGMATVQPELAAAGQGLRQVKKGNASGGAQTFVRSRMRQQAKADRAARRRAPKPPRATSARKPKAPKPAKVEAPKEPGPKETPVYYGGKRVGVERDGVVVLDKKEAS